MNALKVVIHSVLEFASFRDFWLAYIADVLPMHYVCLAPTPRRLLREEGTTTGSSSINSVLLGLSVPTVTPSIPRGVAFCSGTPNKRHIDERTSSRPQYT